VQVDVTADQGGIRPLIESHCKRELRKVTGLTITDSNPDYVVSIVAIPDDNLRSGTRRYWISFVVVDAHVFSLDRLSHHGLILRAEDILEEGIISQIAKIDSAVFEPDRRAFDAARDKWRARQLRRPQPAPGGIEVFTVGARVTASTELTTGGGAIIPAGTTGTVRRLGALTPEDGQRYMVEWDSIQTTPSEDVSEDYLAP
jgi:hypothetical protein